MTTQWKETSSRVNNKSFNQVFANKKYDTDSIYIKNLDSYLIITTTISCETLFVNTISIDISNIIFDISVNNVFVEDLSINNVFNSDFITSNTINSNTYAGTELYANNIVYDVFVNSGSFTIENITSNFVEADTVSASSDIFTNNVSTNLTSLNSEFIRNILQDGIINIFTLLSQFITNINNIQDVSISIIDVSMSFVTSKNNIQDTSISKLDISLNEQFMIDNIQNVFIKSFFDTLKDISNETITLPSQTVINPVIATTYIDGSINTNITLTLADGTTDNFIKTIDLTKSESSIPAFLNTFVNNGTNDNIQTIAIDNNNNVYVGGQFTTAGGISANRIAKWNGTSWSSLDSGLNNTCTAIAVDNNNNLYVGGAFTTAGGISANRIAKWNGSSWSSLVSGLNNTCTAIAVDNNNNLYVGGTFTTAGGISANRVAKWNGTSWSSLSSGLNDVPRAIAVDNNNNVYIGGQFTTAGGFPANRIAKWNGSFWSSLGSGLNLTCIAIGIDNDNNVYAGGFFTSAGGTSANRIAKWNGTSWSSLSSGLNDTGNAIAIDNNNNLYVGGTFTTAGGYSANRIVKIQYIIQKCILNSNLIENNVNIHSRQLNTRLKLRWDSNVSRWVVLGDNYFIENGDTSIYTMKNVGIYTSSPQYNLDVAGTIRCQSLTQTSDTRLKENIIPINNVLDKVSKLSGVSFNFTNECSSKNNKDFGFIAQEVEPIFPELISNNFDLKSIKYQNITALLVEAIKELNEINIQIEKKKKLLNKQ
jgi:hypothetical protein